MATYVFFGDSIMAGNELNHSGQGGTNDMFDRWCRKYAVGIKGATEENWGVSGRTLCAAFDGSNNFENNKTDVPTYDSGEHRLLFMGFGTNDVYKGGGYSTVHTTFVAKYQELIQYIKTTKGWPAAKIVICWYFFDTDLPIYNIDASDLRLLFNEVKAGVIDTEGTSYIDFHPYIDGLAGKADYSHNPANDDIDHIHPQNYPSFNANQIMADAVDSLIQVPSIGVLLRGRKLTIA